MYEGIPFLNGMQEEWARSYWKSNVGASMDLDTTHRDLLRTYCSQIARWSVQARDGDIFTIEKNSGWFVDVKSGLQIILPLVFVETFYIW